MGDRIRVKDIKESLCREDEVVGEIRSYTCIQCKSPKVYYLYTV